MPDIKISGSCACGQLSFSSNQSPVLEAICHCADCRAATGEPFTATAFFKSDALRFEGEVQSQEFIAESGAVTQREYCPNCNCVVIDRSAGVPGLVGVVIKYIAPPFEGNPVCHMWVRSKDPSVTISDDLIQYEERIKR